MFWGIFSFNYIMSESYSLAIIAISLLYRFLYSKFIEITRFKTKSKEIIWITFVVTFIYTLNYCYLYLTSPYYTLTSQ